METWRATLGHWVPDVSTEGSGSKTLGEEGDTLLRNVENNEATKHHTPQNDIPPLHHCEKKKSRSNFVSSCGRLCETEGLQYPVM